jgi:hypothetical protein
MCVHRMALPCIWLLIPLKLTVFRILFKAFLGYFCLPPCLFPHLSLSVLRLPPLSLSSIPPTPSSVDAWPDRPRPSQRPNRPASTTDCCGRDRGGPRSDGDTHATTKARGCRDSQTWPRARPRTQGGRRRGSPPRQEGTREESHNPLPQPTPLTPPRSTTRLRWARPTTTKLAQPSGPTMFQLFTLLPRRCLPLVLLLLPRPARARTRLNITDRACHNRRR